MTQEQQNNSNNDLIQDDFEWKEDIDEAPKTPEPTDQAKTTELDRIEFEEVKESPPQSTETEKNVDDEPGEPKSKKTRRFNFVFPTKLLMLAGISVIVFTAVAGSIYYYLSGREKAPPKSEIAEFETPLLYERVLSDFVIPMQQTTNGSFISYNIRLIINANLYDYYLAKERRVRAEIYETLKKVNVKEDADLFSHIVRQKVNKRFKKNIIQSAVVESSSRI